MPYIIQDRRKLYDAEIAVLISAVRRQVEKSDFPKGDLTYILYKIALDVIGLRELRYTNISDILSCLIDAERELRRKVLNEYEDNMIEKNGDI